MNFVSARTCPEGHPGRCCLRGPADEVDVNRWIEVFAVVKTTKADYVAFEGYNTSIGDFGWSRGLFQNVCPDGDEFVRQGLAFVRPLG